MRVLAIDTAADVGVIAVTDGGAPLSEITARVRARHGETLLPNVERALSYAGLGIADIELIVIGLGPGSFTGVRIGVATAKGLALARRTPLVGVRTTRAIARGSFGALRIPVVDAHKGEVFVAAYAERDADLEPVIDEMHGTPEAMAHALREQLGDERLVLVGSGLALYRDRFTSALGGAFTIAPRALDVPRGLVLALEGEEALARRGPDDLAALEPLYVRASDALLPSSRPVVGVPAATADRADR